MPINVPLVDTFAPYRESIGNLTNALQAAPKMQLEKIQLGEAQRHQQENQELQQLMARTPTPQRPQVAIDFLESKGRTQDAAVLRHERFQQFHERFQLDPDSAVRDYPEYGVDPSKAYEITSTQIPGTKSVAIRQAGKTSFVQRDPTDAEVQAEAQARAAGTLAGGRKTPEQLAEEAKQAGAVAGAQETAKQAARPDKTVERTVDLGNEIEYIYTDGTREKVKKGASPNTIIQVGAQGQQRDFKNETAMRQEFTKLPEVKTFQVIDSQMSRAQKAMEEATKPGARLLAVDQTLITVLNKMLDPSSVVRESEYARTPGDQALLDSIKGKIGKISSGGAGLTTPERKALSQMINNFYQIAKQQYDNQVDYYSDLAKRYGHDPENIVRLGGKKSTPSEVSPSAGLPPGIKVTRIK